jgi:hypothetical protein
LIPKADTTTFCTHIGNFRYKRLNFGINTAAEIFQKKIEELISDIESTINVSDDINVGGRDQEEHDRKLKLVLERLDAKDLTVNEAKCEFSKTEIDFFGLRFSSNGISIQTSNLEAMRNASRPKSVNDVRSFLGLASYCSRFIPNFSTIAKPLRDLTKKKQQWHWGDEQEKAFEDFDDRNSIF